LAYYNYPYGYAWTPEVAYEDYLRQMQHGTLPTPGGGMQHGTPPAHGGGMQHGTPPAHGGGMQHGTPPAHGGGMQHGTPPTHGGGQHHGFPPPPPPIDHHHGGYPPAPHGYPGGHDHHGYPPYGGGQYHGGPPTVPPPSIIPHETVGLYAVDPGGIRGCLYRYTYIWLNNGRSFWYYPTYVGRTSVAGYRWRGNNWEYYGMDLRTIRSYSCH
jgi:hypothetical protein